MPSDDVIKKGLREDQQRSNNKKWSTFGVCDVALCIPTLAASLMLPIRRRSERTHLRSTIEKAF